jgi:transposase
MLTLPPTVRVFLAVGVTDMRKQFDGLAALTRDVLSQDPLSGHLFCFCNRRRDRVKILYFDRSGYWMFAKRLEKGTFRWPSSQDVGAAGVEMTAEELTLILGGLDTRSMRRRDWWGRRAEKLA